MRQITTKELGSARSAEAAFLLASIVESSEDAIISKDFSGVVTTWNKAAERMFGYTAAEMIGSPILRLFPEERHAEEQEILARLDGPPMGITRLPAW